MVFGRIGWLATVAATSLACAPELVRSPVTFSPSAGEPQTIVTVTRAVSVTPSTGYTKNIAAGSTWRRVGTTDRGEVYQPVSAVFAVEGANMHEAYLVVRAGQVVGFYLPGEDAFAPLPEPVALPAEQEGKP